MNKALETCSRASTKSRAETGSLFPAPLPIPGPVAPPHTLSPVVLLELLLVFLAVVARPSWYSFVAPPPEWSLRLVSAILGFDVEAGKLREQKIERPVFFGENGVATLRYQIDAYHPEWECGLEIEAGRAWMGNAVYRDLIQACVMVQVKFLVLAVSNAYKYKSAGRQVISQDYGNAVSLADALYGHSRLRLPFDLILIGY